MVGFLLVSLSDSQIKGTLKKSTPNGFPKEMRNNSSQPLKMRHGLSNGCPS